MGFLAPLFLAGALAAVVPILLHLRRRERRNVVVFPSLMFLRGAPPPAASRRRLDHLLLLALRVAIVVLLAIAFARPVLERVLPSGFLEGGRDVVILLDRSPSMAVAGRMETAREAALAELARLGGRDRAVIVTFADRASALTELTGDQGRLREAIRSVQPAGGPTRYAPAFQLAARLLADGQRREGEVILIGDLQRVGWSPAENGLLPAGTRVRVVGVDREDVTLPARPASLEAHGVQRGDREIATIELRASHDAEWILEVDGREAGRARTPGGSLAAVSFPPLPLPERPLQARVPLPPGGPDDALRLVLERGRAPRVAVVRPRGSAGDGYLATALQTSVAPPIASTIWRGATPSDRDLATTSVVALDDAPVSGDDAARLLRWVEQGGGLVIALGTAAADLPAELAAAAGLARNALVDRATGSVALVDASHPAFGGPRAAAASTLPGAAVWRYHRLTAAGDADVLVRADDGSPILIERRLGRGRVLAWGSTFDGRWGDVVRHPGFVPLVHGIAIAAAGGDPPAASFETGSTVDLAALLVARAVRGTPPAEGERLTLAGPGSERQIVPVQDGAAVARLERPGFYEVRRERGAEGALLLAVNVPAAEWGSERLAPEEIIAAVTTEEEMMPNPSVVSPAQAVEQVEREQRLWWWVLVAVGTLLAVEGFVANRLARPYTAHIARSTGGER